MKTNCIPNTLKQLKGRMDKGRLSMDHPLQRVADQWSLSQQQLLVDSVLRGMIVPPFYMQKTYTEEPDKAHKGKFVSNDSCIDGKQRLTTLFKFLDDGFKLADDMDSVILDDEDGEEFEVAGKLFSELDPEVQYAIREFRLPIYVIEDATDAEIEECISRLNSGTPFTKTQKAKTMIGYDLAKFLNELSQRKFFNEICAFSKAQRKGEQDKCTIIQSMLILDWMAGEYDLKTISEADVMEYSRYARENYTEDKKAQFISYVDYLEQAITEKSKFLKKVNVPMVIYMAKIALENNINAESFGKWFLSFAASDVPGGDYAQYRSQGSVKKQNVSGRIDYMKADFDYRFNL